MQHLTPENINTELHKMDIAAKRKLRKVYRLQIEHYKEKLDSIDKEIAEMEKEV